MAILKILKFPDERLRIKAKPVLDFDKTVEMTAEWYNNYYNTSNTTYATSINQIKKYVESANKNGLKWAL